MQNLSMTVTGKFTEWLHIYLVFSKIAREEGLEQMAVMFEHVSEIEKIMKNSLWKPLSNK